MCTDGEDGSRASSGDPQRPVYPRFEPAIPGRPASSDRLTQGQSSQFFSSAVRWLSVTRILVDNAVDLTRGSFPSG